MATKKVGSNPVNEAFIPGYDKEVETVNHPQHYGGDTTYEAIKVIEAWQLDFCLGNTVKYISRAGKKDPNKEMEDLLKAKWYLKRRIAQLALQTGDYPPGKVYDENMNELDVQEKRYNQYGEEVGFDGLPFPKSPSSAFGPKFPRVKKKDIEDEGGVHPGGGF